ncbi:ferredoxin:protochlorophyllide reductase (ATP-dependent) subunit B [Sandaracinobacteroides saxicola]|uniref:Light-independent protochlorophyllide reductase subunit B n=1 Tax=Sandaracinobacteroides saxicola TaxID=2759707 RepID=A0A7G5IEK0_9SPHN|nr:ferredoxin:protochlorophyllide reductase (ATP-dependent) subunit B [Sandaracinobacteroides saxicola]QMW21792.1 ferredoxin:protochlorophyllide reductase (ATP-dependent) subunit B [Sandaracinobacteroides saxicola]
MQLTVWTYEGPPHVGAMRVVTGMRDTHLVLHAPQGDTYADLLFTMIERRGHRPPVSFTTFQARDLGSDTAGIFQASLRDAAERFQPKAMLVGASCTAELIQDDPGGLATAMGLGMPVIALELPSYSRKENWGAAETFYAMVRGLADKSVTRAPMEGRRPRANLLGPTALGFRHRDDVREVSALLARMGVDVAVVAPMGAGPEDIARLGEADFNVLMYPETGDTAARWLEKTFRQPVVRTVPIGQGATAAFIAEVAAVAGVAPVGPEESRLPWWSHSVDSTYLTGKRVFIFGDATHAIAMARVARDELGFEVVGLGCYNREFAREMRTAAALYGVEPLISDDYLQVESAIAALQPELVLGTQMERHIAKRLRIPCAVISAPVHVQDFPARHSPVMGFEGANVLFDTLIHPLVMGLEEHLLTMFREDHEFHDGVGPSHLGAGSGGEAPSRSLARVASPASGGGALVGEAVNSPTPGPSPEPKATKGEREGSGGEVSLVPGEGGWTAEAERELLKIPFFVRGKARRNTESYARDRGVGVITLDTLYEAKAHHAR